MTTTRLCRALCASLAVMGAGAGTAEARLLAFRSPSGNITCAMKVGGGDRFAQCELRSEGRGYSIPRTGRVTRYDVDPDDDLASRRSVLRYGHARRLGVFTCRSRRSGMRCTNRATGHGFALSRQHQRVF